MSDSGAIATGIGIGLLIALPALVAFRHDIARSIRNIFAVPKREQEVQTQQRGTPRTGRTQRKDTEAISPTIALFAISAALITMFYGLVSDAAIFIATGTFGVLCVGLAFLGSRLRRS